MPENIEAWMQRHPDTYGEGSHLRYAAAARGQVQRFLQWGNSLGVTLEVVGYHLSKSCTLPVMGGTLNGVPFAVRDNFYDVCLIVESETPLGVGMSLGEVYPRHESLAADEAKCLNYTWKSMTDAEIDALVRQSAFSEKFLPTYEKHFGAFPGYLGPFPECTEAQWVAFRSEFPHAEGPPPERIALFVAQWIAAWEAAFERLTALVIKANPDNFGAVLELLNTVGPSPGKADVCPVMVQEGVVSQRQLGRAMRWLSRNVSLEWYTLDWSRDFLRREGDAIYCLARGHYQGMEDRDQTPWVPGRASGGFCVPSLEEATKILRCLAEHSGSMQQPPRPLFSEEIKKAIEAFGGSV
jgi:hypothetical protein